MFENLTPAAGQPQTPISPAGAAPTTPAAAPQPVNDMFAGLDNGLGTPPPPAGMTMPTAETSAPAAPETSNRKYFIVGLLVVLLIALIAGGVFAYQKLSGYLSAESGPAADTAATPTPTPSPAEPANQAPAVEPAPVDQATTSIPVTSTEPQATTSTTVTSTEPVADMVKDSDGDGLTDYEETKFYQTDPANPDSDGDSFKDGDEVRKGYNPLGAGKMIDSQLNQPVGN